MSRGNLADTDSGLDVVSATPAEQRRILNRFLAECGELRELEAKLARFSVFRVLRFEEGEIRHSNVLAWLLDPSGSHGLGDTVVKRFWTLLKAAYPDESQLPDVIDVEAATFEETEIRREWADTKTRDRLDLLLVLSLRGGGQWVLAMEIKVGSSQGKDQLAKYEEKVEAEYRDANRRVYVFLTRDGEEPAEGTSFLGVDFGLIHRALTECLRERGDLIAPGPKNLMQDYLQLLETRFMPENEIEKLARKIYREHREAFDLILTYRPDFLQSVSDNLGQELPNAVKPLGFKILKVTRGWVYLLPTAWDCATNRNERGTYYLHCLIDFREAVFFRIPIAGGENDFRNRIIQAANTSDFHRATKKQPGKTWRALHTEKLKVEMKTDEQLGDEEEVSKQLVAAIEKALGTDAMARRVEQLAKVL